MSVAYNPPNSTVVVNIPEGSTERYEAAGWKPVEKPKTSTRKRSSDSDDKGDK